MESLAALLEAPPGVAWVLTAVAVMLLAATVFRGVRMLVRPGPGARRGWRSLGTWWILYLLLLLVLALGPVYLALLMLALSLSMLREALKVVSREALFLPAGLLVLGLFLWVWVDWASVLLGAFPAVLSILVLWELVARARGMPGKWQKTRWTVLALLLPIAGPLYVTGLLSLPTSGVPAASWQGLVVGLLLLTELNDMAQAWVGRPLGKHAMAPRISPGKSWEGFLGGLGVTVLAGYLLLPYLTAPGPDHAPLGEGFLAGPRAWALLVAALLALSGVAGDLSASLLKRKGGVKDAGQALPAQGGFLDRFDSLSLAAPVYLFVTYLLGGQP